jgi:hypothetical protein
LIAVDSLAGGVQDGSAYNLPVSFAKGKSFTGWHGAFDNVAKLVPSSLTVEESAGGELVSHGLRRKLIDKTKVSWFGA